MNDLTTTEAATLLKVPKARFKRRSFSRKLGGYLLDGRLRFPQHELYRYIERCRGKALDGMSREQADHYFQTLDNQ